MSIPSLVDVSTISDSIFKGLDSLFTSKEEKTAANLAIFQAVQQPHVLQAIANIEEAKSPSVFVAGWRPGLGWVSVICLAYVWLLKDFIIMSTILAGKIMNYSTESIKEILGLLPAVDANELMTLVTLLLGLGGIRAWEGMKGVKRNRL